jgi:periplasmic copper chaperone A
MALPPVLYWIRRPGLAVSAFLMMAAAPPEGVAISQPWMRFITASSPVAGYFTMTNNTDREVALTGAESSDCHQLMVHRSLELNGMSQMKMVERVVVPPHGSVKFEPGGYHLMCMAPSPAATPGHRVPVTLHFEDGRSLPAEFPVRRATGK